MLLNRARAFILILAVAALLPRAVGSQAPAVDPAAVAQLVPLPSLADDESEQQGDEHGEQGKGSHRWTGSG